MANPSDDSSNEHSSYFGMVQPGDPLSGFGVFEVLNANKNSYPNSSTLALVGALGLNVTLQPIDRTYKDMFNLPASAASVVSVPSPQGPGLQPEYNWDGPRNT